MRFRLLHEPAKVVNNKAIYIISKHLWCFLIDYFCVGPDTIVIIVEELRGFDGILHAFEPVECTRELCFCRMTFEVDTIVFYRFTTCPEVFVVACEIECVVSKTPSEITAIDFFIEGASFSEGFCDRE